VADVVALVDLELVIDDETGAEVEAERSDRTVGAVDDAPPPPQADSTRPATAAAPTTRRKRRRPCSRTARRSRMTGITTKQPHAIASLVSTLFPCRPPITSAMPLATPVVLAMPLASPCIAADDRTGLALLSSRLAPIGIYRNIAWRAL
jgi:hypothetical protein